MLKHCEERFLFRFITRGTGTAAVAPDNEGGKPASKAVGRWKVGGKLPGQTCQGAGPGKLGKPTEWDCCRRHPLGVVHGDDWIKRLESGLLLKT